MLRAPKVEAIEHVANNKGALRCPIFHRIGYINCASTASPPPVQLNDYVDIGIFGPNQAEKTENYDASGQPLFFRKVKLTQPKTVLTFVVDKKPATSLSTGTTRAM